MDQASVRDSRNARADRRLIESVYRDYLNDLAAASTGIFPALGEIGHRAPDQLMRWYADPNAQIMTILFGDQRVGFAMVTQRLRQSVGGGMAAAVGAEASPSAASEYSMAEFFVARPWRRRGIGAQAVRLLLDRFTGQWLITEDPMNSAAGKFWRRVVYAYTGSKYQERIVNGEVHQRFESGSRRAPR